jgi:DNA-binding MurR/RpiR family transcriptional regulator
VYCIGLGEDGIAARAFSMRLSLIGIMSVHHFDTVLMSSGISAAGKGDVLLVFSEDGDQSTLSQISRQFRERQGKVISVTRHTANPLRAHADLALLVSAHDERVHIKPLLYQSALQQLLDLIFVLLCEGNGRLARLDVNLSRIRNLREQ